MTSYPRSYIWKEATFSWSSAKAQGLTWAGASRTAPVVLSDVKIRAGDLTDADFEVMLLNDGAAGYDDFRPFVSGDYTYQKALFKVTTTTTGTDVPTITAIGVSLDVPDVIECGISDVISSGTRVYFNKSFLAPPTVTAVLKGGVTFGVPKIISVTRTYFDVVVMESASSNIEATISWNAVGY